ncbi:MAG: AAA family ATPase, partial [Bradyrhizobium sp.]|uniref:adenylate/guanylate cyclase domain-containing protein n=1 Tax=Bradyrhizobium sp. TaxID=376 RepID=UPI001DC98A78
MQAVPDDGICRSCGVSFSTVCSSCDQPNLHAARFCSGCGERLAQAPAQGERKVVTVMFADIVGSTELIGPSDPEQAMDRLSPALNRMGDAVQQFQGTVTRSMGDGLLAIFGIPQAREDHALRACQAALAMMPALSEHGIALRVGIHSGEIVTGVPDKFTREQSVYGAAVHLASRLEHMARPGEIYLTESTFRLVHSFCEAHSIGQQDFKGFPTAINVYRLVGMRPSRTPFKAAILGAYRGRDRDLTVLHEALASAERGDGKAIGISAAPGLGKSRLCFEFAKAVKVRQVPVLRTSASLYNHSGPLQPLVEFLRGYFRIVASDDAEAVRTKIAARIETIVPRLIADVPILVEFLCMRDRRPPPTSDPKARRARLINLVCSMVRDGTRTPTVIVIEDIHWLDEASVEFVAALVDVIASSGVLLVLTYRSTYQPPWARGTNFAEIRLEELRDEDVSALIRDMIGDRSSTRAIRDRIVERSGGNPFFAEELTRSLVDSGELDGRVGDYEAAQPDQTGTLPATIQSVIGARIDRL